MERQKLCFPLTCGTPSSQGSASRHGQLATKVAALSNLQVLHLLFSGDVSVKKKNSSGPQNGQNMSKRSPFTWFASAQKVVNSTGSAKGHIFAQQDDFPSLATNTIDAWQLVAVPPAFSKEFDISLHCIMLVTPNNRWIWQSDVHWRSTTAELWTEYCLVVRPQVVLRENSLLVLDGTVQLHGFKILDTKDGFLHLIFFEL